jgi:type II secretory pathway pseudopilin PulG
MKRWLSLVELAVAVVIIGLVAMSAVPRFGQASTSNPDLDARESANVLRLAIEMYYHEHGAYPGRRGDGVHEPGTEQAVINQLTKYTDAGGRVSLSKSASYCYGPYLRRGIPPCPVQPHAGQVGVLLVGDRPAYHEVATAAGWVYNCQTGDIALNSNATDASGAPYDRY